MKKLLVFLRDYKKESVLAPLFKLLEASFELFVPLVMAKIIDVGIGTGDNSYVLKMCGVLILLAFIGLTCAITAQYFAAKAAVGFATKLRHALFEHIQKLSFDELDRIGTSTLITRMTSDINQVQSGVNMVLRLFLRSPFIVFGAMVMAFTIDVKAALIFVVTIPALSVVVFGIMYVSIPLFKKVQSGLDEVLSLTRENLEGSRVIRAFRKEQEETAQFEQKNGLLTGMQLHVGKISALMNPLTYIIINFALVALIWQGGLRVNVGAITQGEVVALVNYMSQILVELVKLANLIVTVNKSVACGNRIAQVLEMESSMEDGTLEIGENFSEQEISEKKSVVSFEDVSMCYQGSKEDAITHISFTAGAGETIGIIGGTGSGKTTVVRKIIESLPAGQTAVIPQDSYYWDSSHIPVEERQNINFDEPAAIDFNLLVKHLKELKAGHSIEQPIYSFLTCTRSNETITVEPRDIVIVEGILILCNEELRNMMDMKVFVDADADDRLIRVINRDIIERGRTVEMVIERYERVLKPMHLQHIEPTKRYADIIIPQGGHNSVAIEIMTNFISHKLKG